MAYVVTQNCIGNKHTSCVDVCPVEAFREAPEMLFIDPDVCIDCNACVSACPEGAIFPRSMVPDDQQNFITLNGYRTGVNDCYRPVCKKRVCIQYPVPWCRGETLS